MSDTARAADADDGVPVSSATVPAVGTALSVVAFVALALSIGSGVDDVAVVAAAVAALLAAGAFLARRDDRLGRRVGGAVAAGSSLAVVALSGYVIALGSTGSISIPGLGWSVSTLFLAFFVAIGAVSAAVAESAGISGQGLVQRTRWLIEVSILAAVGLLSLSAAGALLALPAQLVFGELSEFQWTVINYLAMGVGLTAVSLGYLAFRERDRSFLDLERPTLRTISWIAVGLVVILGANVGMSSLMSYAGIEGSEHSLTEDILENPDLLLVVIPAMLLIVGPAEELLYRNVIQKSLYEPFSRYGAVVATSVVFTLVHIPAYATAGAGELLASLSLLFVLSLILGTVYERTDNLLVPALVHGGYNAVVVALVLV
ncbi:CPBP family intramembrane glutamic endopeptidase [Natronolimnohabitans innermongolicus]|uniref:CAAX prenyl protease 2/Lysostaphin resistance protein A-like domain-containing protein n=1 Tax=Natronolimnohabitans innermongolicus JCM 12255 TaxID=1227499 RepID=L9XEM0_9EURY|nr:CPBP family intramembrane glutamic endopeptidase [Natronolimnohabitans innermongolicus]ELY59088.1 hypothetical protein C493_05540 [Natronolimnohabitans innermongolicus JCM 12255]